MRLEDWQKFIESQFLEDGGAAETPAETAAQDAPNAPVEPPETARLIEVKTDATAATESVARPVSPRPDFPYAPVTTRPTVSAESREARPLFTPPDLAQSSPLTLPFAERDAAPPIAAPEVSLLESAAATETSAASYRQTLDFDADIPDFAAYMPTRSAGKAAEALTAPLKIDADATPAPKPEIKTDAQDQAQAKIEARTVAAPPVIPQVGAAQGGKIAANSEETDEDGPLRIARNPRSRARHARNARPEEVPSGLAAAAMWAAVPRHVQTLLALERIEEKEIAQSSYKRPFAEGRLELIERLLDPILSLEDTARLLNVCPTTVRRYTNRGILTHYRKEPERSGDSTRPTERETRQRRFRLSDILAFLETQQAALKADRETERLPRRAANKTNAAHEAAPAAP